MAKTYFIRINSAKDLRVLDEGDIFQAEPTHGTFFLASGKNEKDKKYGHITDKKGFIEDEGILRDLRGVVSRQAFDTSKDGSFSPYVPEVERNKIMQDAEAAGRKYKQVQTTVTPLKPVKNTASEMSGLHVHSAPAKGKKVNSGSLVGGSGKEAQVKPSAKAKSRVEMDNVTNYPGFTKKELNTLFRCAFKDITGKEPTKNDFKLDEQQQIDEYVDPFIVYTLPSRRVADDCIPPLSILMKIDLIKNNPALKHYYTKKLNRMPAQVTFMGKLGNKLKFDTSTMPGSLRLAGAVAGFGGKLALKGGGAVLGALRSLGTAKNADKEPTFAEMEKSKQMAKAAEHEKSSNEAVAARNETGGQNIQQAATQAQTAPKDSASVSVSPAAPNLFMKVLGSMDKHLMNIDKSLQPKDTDDDKSAQAIVGKEAKNDLHSVASVASKSDSKPEEKKSEKSGGLLSMLLGALKFLLNPMKMLGSGLMSLLSLITKFGGGLISILTNLGKGLATTIAPAIKSIASRAASGLARVAMSGMGTLAAGVAAPIMASVGIAAALDSHQETLDKAAGHKTQAEYAKEGPSFLDVLTGKHKDKVVHNADGSTMDAYGRPLSPATAVKESQSQAVQAMQKNKSAALANTEVAKENATDNKQASTQKQMIDASSKNATTIVQQAAAQGSRLMPRTSDSTFRTFLNSRSAFA
jgi:hypothetical protein